MIEDDRVNRLAELLAELVELTNPSRPVEIPAPRTPLDRTLLTVEEAAERLGIGRTRMFALLKSGEVESVRIGRSRRIHIRAIDEYAEGLRTDRNTNKDKEA